MGSPEGEVGRDNDEGLQHDVKVAPFALSKTEVTFAEYARFAKATGRPLPSDEGWGGDTRPVINVNWQDATAYADWLSQRTGEAYRLPTEAEWEYAARAGSTTAYWWGNDIQRGKEVMANCDGCGSEWDNKQTAPVGSFPANKFGLYDLHGNVWEWTADCWHDNYDSAPTDGRAWEDDASGGCCRVVRGGSWGSKPAWMRSASRFRLTPGGANYFLGFRLARTLP
jgi:formylglycine-generating enzyme required for sulfatase activity